MRGGHNSKGKIEADGLMQISTYILKKYGYFAGRDSGTIVWNNGWTGVKSNIRIEVETREDGGNMRIYYTKTDYDTGKTKKFDYKIPLTTTPCPYGGKRYWFRCLWYKNGQYCSRRVGTLYLLDDYFVCRYCNNLTYASRNEGKQSKKMMEAEKQFWNSFKERMEKRVLAQNYKL